jgi:multidrug transporter EmrE-like cation transporter
VIAWIALGAGVVLNASASLFVKAGMRGDLPLAERIFRQPWLLLGLACFGLAFICYATALAKIPITVVYPVMTGLGMAIVTTAAALWFGEGITWTLIAGMALIVAGVAVITRA